ncbi:MAG: hypothetical protein GXO58_00455 [Thermodesulfobacteria bacterium]|nr:hypothetical protein [Thermodesulfobacteriota bacterium]
MNTLPPELKKGFGLLALLGLALLLCGFNFSDPNKLRIKLRKEIRAELEKIIEKTPSGRLRTTWREKKAVAEEALNQALLLNAPSYCPDQWDDAVILFKRAKKYAAKREYRKAIYLAKKSKESADVARQCADKYIKEQTSKLTKEYKILRGRMTDIMGQIPPDAEDLLSKASSLSLEVEDMANAIDLHQFDQAKRLGKSLKKKISRLENGVKKYKREHTLQDEEL